MISLYNHLFIILISHLIYKIYIYNIFKVVNKKFLMLMRLFLFHLVFIYNVGITETEIKAEVAEGVVVEEVIEEVVIIAEEMLIVDLMDEEEEVVLVQDGVG